MIRYLTLDEILELHGRVVAQSGGSSGLRDLQSLDSAIAQPEGAFAGQEFYPTLVDKAAALAFLLVMNHPFVDGNKRVGHAAMETFLVLNGAEIQADVVEQERIFLNLADGKFSREEFTEWVRTHVVARN